MYLNSTSKADNEADGPFPLHPPCRISGAAQNWLICVGATARGVIKTRFSPSLLASEPILSRRGACKVHNSL